MNLDQIKCFLILSQTLNFTKTAEILYVTQPTISRQIKLLEDELGIKLFYRMSNTIDITPEGTILYESLSEAYEIINEGVEKAIKNVDPKRTSLRIGCETILNFDRFLAECYQAFCKRYPEINIVYEKKPYIELREKLQNKEYDLIFTKWSKPNFIQEEKVVHLFEATGVCLFSSDDPRAQDKIPALREFNNETIICLRDNVSPRGLMGIKKICETFDLKYKNIIQVPNLESVFFYVYAGLGIAFMSKDVDQIYMKGFSYIDMLDEVAKITGVALYNESNTNPAVDQFLEIVNKKRHLIKDKYL